MKPKIIVIIPAFNEESSIGKVIADIPEGLVSEVVVVNNASTDGTAKEAESGDATVIEELRRGYGQACLTGIEYAESLQNRPDIIVFLDGDYSDYPGEMSQIVKPITDGDYDMVIGSRKLGNAEPGAMMPQARFGNALATTLIKWLYGVKFTDLGPFRAIKFTKLRELGMADTTYGWTVEMQVKAAKMGYRCTEVPVSYRKRIGVSKISGTISGSVKAGYKILWTIFKYI
jgi:glycosyltransferase involved in cell wall biosynthesis